MPAATPVLSSMSPAAPDPIPFFPTSCVVLGTDTGCGKTYISTLLVRLLSHAGKRAVGMKPVATGWDATTPPETQEDVAALRESSPLRPDVALQCPYLFPEPISPHLAARHTGIPIQREKIQSAYLALTAIASHVIVESAGGLLSPLNDTTDMIDLPAMLGIPALLVVDIRLGCINQGRLAAAALKAQQVPMLGWVANRHHDHPIAYEDEVIATLKAAIPFPYLELPRL